VREHGFFGGWDGELDGGAGPLGIEHWARRGIAGRGVLIDIVRHRETQGIPYDPHGGEEITAEDLAAAAEAQGVDVETGDILCVRTGWVAGYGALDGDDRADLARHPAASGLRADEEMARWLWDRHVAALCLDNPAIEVIPGDPAVGSLHRRLIPMLGFALAELLDLERLAAACAEDGRWEFLFVAAPMHLPGGVGSPANAVVIR
jgi:kynurenine formamidase